MTVHLADHVTFRDQALTVKYTKRRIPMGDLVENYLAENLDFKGDVLAFMEQREELVRFSFTLDHVKFLFTRFIPEVAIHSKKQDARIVRDHYDRGNDFFNWFLGPTMVYTCGFFTSLDNDLEAAQRHKLDLVAHKLQLKTGESHLDIGCGWGTLILHSATHYGTDSTGITIAERQTEFANDRIAQAGMSDRARVLCLDYRDIPKQIYDKISCLEMAEHVGVKHLQKFIKQIYSLLSRDGLFLLQIAGLRASFHFEDLVWGLFMAKYIFPGADASRPLHYVIRALERADFEIHSVENIGIHYSQTIRCWYHNWLKNRDAITAKYGERWFRIWEIFLAWSIIIARQGSSTCFQIVANKNLNHFDRTRFVGTHQLG